MDSVQGRHKGFLHDILGILSKSPHLMINKTVYIVGIPLDEFSHSRRITLGQS